MDLLCPNPRSVSSGEWIMINAALEFIVANPGQLPPSPTGKTTIDFLQHVQRKGALGKILVADVSGMLGKKAPYFPLGDQPFTIKPWAHYCSSGLHFVEQRKYGGCVRQIRTLVTDAVRQVIVDLDTNKSVDSGKVDLRTGRRIMARIPPTLAERLVAMKWLADRSFTTAITPHGFHVYLLPGRPILIKQNERELEPFVNRVFADFPEAAAGLKLDTCSWSRLNGERISPILLWRVETIAPVPVSLPRILYDLRDRKIGVSVDGVVTKWRTHQSKTVQSDRQRIKRKPIETLNPLLTFGKCTPLLGETSGQLAVTSAEKHEACSKALGMRARYLAWHLLDRELHGEDEFVWQEKDAFVAGVSQAVGLPPDEIANILNRFPPEESASQQIPWGKLNVPCHKIYCGRKLPIRCPHGAKQHFAEFARSIYIFPHHDFSLNETLSICRRFYELLQNQPKDSALGNAMKSNSIDNRVFSQKCDALLGYEPGLANGLADLLVDTASLLGGGDPLLRWLDTDCPRLCGKFWFRLWDNCCEVSQIELEKVLLAVREFCAGDPNRLFTTAEIAHKASITATPRPEKWLDVARGANASNGKRPLKRLKTPARRQLDAAHHKTQVALQLLGCTIKTDGLKNPNRPGCKAKRQAPASVLDPSWKPAVRKSSSPPPRTSLCPSNSIDSPASQLRCENLVEGLDGVLPPLLPAKLQDAIWQSSRETISERLSKSGGDWESVIKRLRNVATSKYKDCLAPALQAVRACLEQDGHTYHDMAAIQNLLRALAQSDEGLSSRLISEILNSGMVIDVSHLVGGTSVSVAWRRHLEGEAAFALSIVRHAQAGGKTEIIFGEPGTGKTESLAAYIASDLFAGRKATVGSAQHNSARSLEDRVSEKHGVTHPVLTVHKAFNVPVDAETIQPEKNKDDSLFADEFGQLDTYVAGAMSSRWRPQHHVILSVGPDQLLPVGPGRVGEDLIDCLRQRPLPGFKLIELVENRRSPDGQAIVDFFRGIKAGEVREGGPALTLVEITDQNVSREDFLAHAIKVTIARRNDWRDDGEPVTCFVPLDELAALPGTEYFRSALHRDSGFTVGERVIIKDNTRQTGLQRFNPKIFSRGTVARVLRRKPDGNIVVQAIFPGQSERLAVAIFPPDQLRSAFCRTVHAAQGFEVNSGVVAIIPSRITDRRWLYTAVSRCRKHCTIVFRKYGQRDDLSGCIAKTPIRKTLFPRLFHLYADQILGPKTDLTVCHPHS